MQGMASFQQKTTLVSNVVCHEVCSSRVYFPQKHLLISKYVSNVDSTISRERVPSGISSENSFQDSHVREEFSLYCLRWIFCGCCFSQETHNKTHWRKTLQVSAWSWLKLQTRARRIDGCCMQVRRVWKDVLHPKQF